MIRVQEASFLRLGYSGDDIFAEVEVKAEGYEAPLIAVFKKLEGGGLELVNVTEKRADFDLDWYDNRLHDAYPDAMENLFGAGSDGTLIRKDFAEQVLGVPGLRDEIEDALFYRT